MAILRVIRHLPANLLIVQNAGHPLPGKAVKTQIDQCQAALLGFNATRCLNRRGIRTPFRG